MSKGLDQFFLDMIEPTLAASCRAINCQVHYPNWLMRTLSLLGYLRPFRDGGGVILVSVNILFSVR